jgi:flagellar protein FliS
MKNIYETYQDIGLSSEVTSASPAELIQLLFEKTIQQINIIKNSIEINDLKMKYVAINKLSDIISYLRDCLHGEDEKTLHVVTVLDSFYELIQSKLLVVSFKNDIDSLNQIHNMLSQVSSAWKDSQLDEK